MRTRYKLRCVAWINVSQTGRAIREKNFGRLFILLDNIVANTPVSGVARERAKKATGGACPRTIFDRYENIARFVRLPVRAFARNLLEIRPLHAG